ncbi:MAG: hypothetical protein QOC85_951, partial [Streptomyces sp.]|nr:hypothetical protein [Streptomyces sp.]
GLVMAAFFPGRFPALPAGAVHHPVRKVVARV